MKRSHYIIPFIVLTFLLGCNQNPANHSENKVDDNDKLELKIAGYDYDRVQAIMNGKVTHKDLDVSFNIENIYSLSLINSQTYNLVKFREKISGKSILRLISPQIFKYSQGFNINKSQDFRHKPVFL